MAETIFNAETQRCSDAEREAGSSWASVFSAAISKSRSGEAAHETDI